MSIFSREKHPRLPLSKLFFYSLLFLLAIQTRKIFFTSQSYYFGYLSFYNTVYLYLTDLIIFGLILAWLWEKRAYLSWEAIKSKYVNDKIYWFLGIFWFILAISLLFSRENFLGLYYLGKITEFIWVFVYVRENFTFQGIFSREKLGVFWLIFAGAVFEAGLGIWQYLFQTSFGLKRLGEEFLRPGIPGLAEFPAHGIVNQVFYGFFPYLRVISDQTVNLRAYGTLPHPNVLAGFLLMALLLNFMLLYLSQEKWKQVGLSLGLLLISTGLVVTFARFAWAVAFLTIVVWFVLIFWRMRRREFSEMRAGKLAARSQQYFPGRLALLGGVLLLALGLNWYLFGAQIQDRLGLRGKITATSFITDESLTDRNLFSEIALKMFRTNPLWGVGLGNFVVSMDQYSTGRLLPYLHQPVHNIYLLIASESGFLALIIFFVLLYYIVRHALANLSGVFLYSLLLIFFGFLAIGLFDHYLWTIQQGSLMFWTVAGFLAIKKTA